MNPVLQLLNDFSTGWSTWLWHATWQGAIVIAVAWLLTVVLARQSPRFRSWIWRLAYVKLLVLLLWTTPLRLAVLPAEADGSESIKPRPLVAQTDPGLNNQAPIVASREPATIHEELPSGAAISPPLVPSDPPVVPTSVSQSPSPLAWQSWLLLTWLIGLTAVLAWLALGVLRAARLWRSARLIHRPDLDQLLQEVHRDLKLRPQAQLAESHLAAGPMLVKFLRPRIIFPAAMIDQLSPDEIRLVLAHELAHIKRRDLAWNALAAIVHLALYFHPLVWLAHRLSRREQELACDELVISRLAVDRHDYGQMLVNVVRQITCNFRCGVAAVGMSGSYKTLSRRLEAMKTIRQFSRQQIIGTALALALLAAISVVPWRLVAQERAPANPAQPANQTTLGSAEGQTASENAAKDQSAQEKLIVGTWRGKDLSSGDTCEWVFQKDGRYQLLLHGNLQPFGGREATYYRWLGKWRIVDGMLAIVPNRELSVLRGLFKFDEPAPLEAAAAAPGVAAADANAPDPESRFKIIRLDESLMRLQPVGRAQSPEGETDWSPMGGVTFCHRVDPKEAPADFDPSLPAQLKEIATLAQLTPKDASKIAPSFMEKDPQSGEPLRWELVGRIVKAKNGKIDFSELFGLEPGEATAYNELLKLVGSYRAAWNLAGDGHLAAQERSALDKLDSLRSRLNAIRRAVGNKIADLQTKFGGTPFGPAEPQPSAQSLTAKEEFEAKMKLKLFLDELDGYLNSTVYNDENLFGGPPPAGGGVSRGDHR